MRKINKTFLGYGEARNFKDKPGFSLLEEGNKVYEVNNDFWCPHCEGCAVNLVNSREKIKSMTKHALHRMQRLELQREAIDRGDQQHFQTLAACIKNYEVKKTLHEALLKIEEKLGD